VLAGSDTEVGVRWYTVLTDQVGTPTELFTPAGELAWQRRPTLWGLADRRGGVDIPLRFPGQYHDAETGLYYNNMRYYDPETARFLSPDPLGLVAALNPVSYVPNPLVWVDPLGLAATQCAPGGVGGGQGNDPGRGDDPGKGKKGKGPLSRFGSKVKKLLPSRSSQRVQQAPSRYDQQRWWHENYGPHTTFGGGTGAHVQLGPASGDPIPGHAHLPGQNELTAVNQLGSPPWIKGHIVNSNLGGMNTSQNLTPLTGNANGSHLHNVETPIKNAITTASQSGRYDHDPYWYGVDFNTTVHHGGPISPHNPQSAVAQHLDINSQYIRQPRVGNGPVEPVPPGQLPPNRQWPPLPNGRLDPTTGVWTPHNQPAAPAPQPVVPGPATVPTGGGDVTMSGASSPLSSPPSSIHETQMPDA
jgi:RHS repeat-associated protein